MFRLKLSFLLSVSATIILLSSCKRKNNDAAQAPNAAGKPKGVMAEAYLVKPVAYAPTYTASGQLLANESIDIHPEVSGRVTGIYFREGSFVRKGQLLIQLFDADVRALIRKLEAQRTLQLATQKRSAELVRIGGISRQDYETAQTNVKSIEADIAANQASLQRLHIVAPFDGTVGIRNVSPGAVVTPATIVASLQQTHPLKMDFSVPDQYKNHLRPGQDVRFYVDGIADTMSGKIAAVDPAADAATHTIRTRAIVPNPNGKLIPGAFAHVIIPFGQGESILIPSQAIIPTTRDKKVALLRGGKALLQTVQIGDRTQDQVQILQGLQVGDTILTTALMQVKPGMEVKVRKIN
jgi:membrane fusion protein (multidrug efflux system)